MDFLTKNYFKLPKVFQHYISKMLYRPVIGKNVELYGWSTFSENVYIDDYTFMHQNRFMRNVKIGKFCAIAEGLAVGLNEHPYTSFSNYRMSRCSDSKIRKEALRLEELGLHKGEREEKTTIIGNDVWIGQNVTIKGGVHVGNGAVIGTGAIVTKDVPPYAIVAGVPARVIKYRFNENKIEQLQQLEWWNLSSEQLAGRLQELENI